VVPRNFLDMIVFLFQGVVGHAAATRRRRGNQ